MSDQTMLIVLAACLAGLLIAIAAFLRGWQGWLELKRAQLSAEHAPAPSAPSPAARIELADLKERVRRLEAIADGAE